MSVVIFRIVLCVLIYLCIGLLIYSLGVERTTDWYETQLKELNEMHPALTPNIMRSFIALIFAIGWPFVAISCAIDMRKDKGVQNDQD